MIASTDSLPMTVCCCATSMAVRVHSPSLTVITSCEQGRTHVILHVLSVQCMQAFQAYVHIVNVAGCESVGAPVCTHIFTTTAGCALM